MMRNKNDLLAAALYLAVCAMSLWLLFWNVGAFK